MSKKMTGALAKAEENKTKEIKTKSKAAEANSFSPAALIGFLKDAKLELNKVTWPTRPEVIANTVVVIVAVVFAAVALWFFDTFFSVIINAILR